MNFEFENEVLEVLASKDFNIVYEDNLSALKGMKLAIDATVLLSQAASSSSPLKFLQEGGASVDLALQQKLV